MKTTVARLTLVCVSIIIISLILAGISDAKIDPKTIVGAWLFDEGSGTTAKDSSENKNDGTLMSGPKWVNGKFGKALEFDGKATYVEVPENKTLDLTDEVTMMCWYFWGGVSPVDGGWQTFVSKGPMSGTNENWALFINDASLYFHFITTPNGARTNINSPNNVVEKGKWQFVAGTYDGKNVRIYLDGKKIQESPMSGKMTPNGSNLRIGHREAAAHYWLGTLDEVGVFNKALTEDQVNDIMQNGLGKALGLTAVSASGKLTSTWASIKAQ
jgi:hypothetical protein